MNNIEKLENLKNVYFSDKRNIQEDTFDMFLSLIFSIVGSILFVKLLSRNVEGMSLFSHYNTNVKLDNSEISEEELLFLIKKKSESIEEIDIENN